MIPHIFISLRCIETGVDIKKSHLSAVPVFHIILTCNILYLLSAFEIFPMHRISHLNNEKSFQYSVLYAAHDRENLSHFAIVGILHCAA